MKRIIATGLAVTLVAATLGATDTAAIAKEKNWHPGPQPPHYPQHYSHPGPGPNYAAPFLFGTFLGLALAPAFYPPYAAPPPPAYYPGPTSTHVAICTQWYGVWYNPATDMWTDSLGGVHRCTAPY
jgi:hypothetical protein